MMIITTEYFFSTLNDKEKNDFFKIGDCYCSFNGPVIFKSGNKTAWLIGSIDYFIINGKKCKLRADSDVVMKEVFSKDLKTLPTLIEGSYILIILNNGIVNVIADKFAQKDIFIYQNLNSYLICDSLGPFRSLDILDGYDQRALANYFTVYGCYAPKKHTLYNNLKRLGVSEYITIDNNRIAIKRLPVHLPIVEDYPESKLEEYSHALFEAIRLRSSSDGINWIYLSSGWDSTAILAVLREIYGPEKVRGVIGQIQYAKRSGKINIYEIERTKKMAEYFGIKIDIVPLDCTKDDSVEYFEKIIPFLRNSIIHSFNSYNFCKLSDFIKDNSVAGDVVFSGEISDGAHNFGFSQYATILNHPDLNFREYADKMASYLYSPSFLNSILHDHYEEDVVYNYLKGRYGNALFDSAVSSGSTKKKMEFLSSFYLSSVRIPFYSLNNSNVLTDKAKREYLHEMQQTYFAPLIEKLAPEYLYSSMIYLYNSFHWQGSTVKVIGKALERYGKEIKLPFWDSTVLDFLMKMPEHWGRGLDFNNTKYPLKWMLKNSVKYPIHLQKGPHSYLYDINPNFNVLAEFLYGSKMKNYFIEVLQKRPYENILQEDYFNIEYINRCVNQYENGVELLGQELNDIGSVILLSMVQ